MGTTREESEERSDPRSLRSRFNTFLTKFRLASIPIWFPSTYLLVHRCPPPAASFLSLTLPPTPLTTLTTTQNAVHPRPRPHTLLPILALSSRSASSPFIAYPVISLAFVAFKFYLAAPCAHNLVDDSKELFIASCFAAQRSCLHLRWMALNTNERIQDVAVSSINASRDSLILV